MPRRFTLVAFDEEPSVQKSSKGTLRLVCRLEGGGKLAIWGDDDSRLNIDAVLCAGLPCTVECERTRQPQPWAAREPLGHTYWIPQGSTLRVLE